VRRDAIRAQVDDLNQLASALIDNGGDCSSGQGIGNKDQPVWRSCNPFAPLARSFGRYAADAHFPCRPDFYLRKIQ
jgi:hypothetical protein